MPFCLYTWKLLHFSVCFCLKENVLGDYRGVPCQFHTNSTRDFYVKIPKVSLIDNLCSSKIAFFRIIKGLKLPRGKNVYPQCEILELSSCQRPIHLMWSRDRLQEFSVGDWAQKKSDETDSSPGLDSHQCQKQNIKLPSGFLNRKKSYSPNTFSLKFNFYLCIKYWLNIC